MRTQRAWWPRSGAEYCDTSIVPRLEIALAEPLDLTRTLGIHWRGPLDPTMRLGRGDIVRTTRTHDGPATLRLRLVRGRLAAEAWGPGADAALTAVPALVGLDDEPWAFHPEHPLLRELARRSAGLRIGRTGAVWESLFPAILEQKVTGTEAYRAFRAIVRRYGEPAPGLGGELGLWLQPTPETLAGLPYHRFHQLGVERRRADTIRFAATRANRLEACVAMPPDAARRRLESLPGIGAWTAAEVALRALGDVDAVSVGDYHLPSLVAFALAGEPRATDARMLELLEPYRGQRARVIRLLETSGIGAPRYGPRMAPREIAAI